MPRLDEAVEQVLDAAVAAIESSPDLTELASVVRGERARPMPELPAVWVVPEPAVQAPETYGPQETWTLPLSLAALVRSDDPDEGARTAARIAALARRAVLLASWPSWVLWARSVRCDLAARSSERNRVLHWADVTVEVRFSVEEVP
ncbi:hypothetical protein HRbin12_00990 [bacterium HR12]|nr:hypothetical protein HRbin12_00990 [bacterium HR12]